MAGVITTGSHPKALWPGIRQHFGGEYEQHDKEYPALFEDATSNKNYEEDVQYVGMGLIPIKPEGKAIAYDSTIQGYVARYTNVTYGMGYIITLEEQKDNLYYKVSMGRAKSLAFSTNQTIEVICANVYNRAFNSSFLGGDGVELISAVHPLSSGGTSSNIIATGADLSEAAIEDLLIQIMLATNDRGLQIALSGKSLHVHPNDWFEANRILKSVLQNDTANNALNVIKSTNALPKGIHVNHYFSDTDAWFIRTHCHDGMKVQWREKPVLDKDNDFQTKNLLASVYWRFVPSWTDWRDTWGSSGV